MDHYYVACDLGAELGRVMLGTLHKDKLVVSEVHRFQNQPASSKGSVQWNIPLLYHEILSGLRELSTYDEPVDGISCSSWPGDYLLFEADGSLMTPAYHFDDPRNEAGLKTVLAKLPWKTIYDETGVSLMPANTLFQLAAEKPRRLKRARHLMPVADGFNYLLSGAARIEMSQASATQLYNPFTGTWSQRLLEALELRPDLFPPLALAGTKLGALRPEVAKQTGLDEARVVTTCSHELAAALVGLPVNRGENWAFMRSGPCMTMGTELINPLISDESREANFTNEMGFGGSVHFHKRAAGLWMLDECKKFWKERDRELDDDVLRHLAIGAPPFESLIAPDDARFFTPGDMPLKIQAYCRDTNQPVPRKPGPITRCILESLALHYRKTLQEIEQHTGREFTRVYLIGGSAGDLLYHFTANALQIPLTIAPSNSAAIGNVIVQALALGHVGSLEQAREIVRNSFKLETITPHAAVWNDAYGRLAELVPS